MNNNKPRCIREGKIRRLTFYKKYIEYHNKSNFTFNSLVPNERSINKYLCESHPKVIERNNFIDEMISLCDKYILPDDEFDWVKKDKRICFWLWLKVRDEKDIDTFYMGLSKPIRKTYDSFNINDTPLNTKERYNLITSFFDNLNIDVKTIREYLSKSKKEVIDIINNKINFNWLKIDNKEQCDWALRYIRNKDPIIFNKYITSTECPEEIYLSVIASFDSWQTSAAEKELFLIKIKKAWSQKKYRDEISDKKLLNTYISQDAKRKLDRLTKGSKKKINEVIEDLINKEYEKL